MGLQPGVGYVVRNPWSKTDIATFTNTWTVSQGAESISLYRIRKNNYYQTTAPTNNVYQIFPAKSYTITGTGFSAMTYGTYDTTHLMVEGFVQTAANNTAEITIPVPNWANSVEFVACYKTSAANTVLWTNKPFLRYATPTGYVSLDADFDPVAYPEHTVTCTSGTLTKTTNIFTFPTTNTAKYISLQWKAVTNGGAISRTLIGAPNLRFY